MFKKGARDTVGGTIIQKENNLVFFHALKFCQGVRAKELTNNESKITLVSIYAKNLWEPHFTTFTTVTVFLMFGCLLANLSYLSLFSRYFAKTAKISG